MTAVHNAYTRPLHGAPGTSIDRHVVIGAVTKMHLGSPEARDLGRRSTVLGSSLGPVRPHYKT